MLGTRLGSRVGAQLNSSIGSSGDDEGLGLLPGVTIDAQSGIYLPANATEWATVMAAAGISSGGPSQLNLCGEAASPLADSIGTFALTVAGPATFNQSVSGWNKTGIKTTDGAATSSSNTDVGLPDPATTSNLAITYAIVTSTPAALRGIHATGTATFTSAIITTTAKFQINSGANTLAGSANILNAVRPYVTLYDVTNNRAVGYTDLERLSVTRGLTTGKNHQLQAAIAPAGTIIYHVRFFGAAAELTDGQIRTLLQTLRWSPLW